MFRPSPSRWQCAGFLAALWFTVVAMPFPDSGRAFAFDGVQSTPGIVKRPSYLTHLIATSPIQPAGELRALWVVRDALESPESIDRLMDFAIRARFQLLFVQVRGRGDAYYRSQIDPPPTLLGDSLGAFDPLDYLLVLARRNGISVHAWLNVFYVWSDSANDPPGHHVVTVHPDWLMFDGSGTRMDQRAVKWWLASGIEGYYLSPARPDVRRYLRDVVAELVANYPINGVHLDYVRYPGRNYGMDIAQRTRFALEWGIDPSLVNRAPGETAAMIGEPAVAAIDSLYDHWRTVEIDSTVMDIRRAVGNLPLSAAVVSDPEVARRDKGQDWTKWVYQGWLDFAVPMVYNGSPEEIQQRVRALQNTVGNDRLLVGLALHDGRDGQFAESVALLRELSVTGFSLFSYNVMAEEPFAVRFLEQALFSEPEPESEE